MERSTEGLSKLRGIGPIILSLGFHPVAKSAYKLNSLRYILLLS
jgi:hypothetical protein